MLNRSWLDTADKFLISEILEELILTHDIASKKAKKLIIKSNFFAMLISHPYFVHHKDGSSWAFEILRQNNLISDVSNIK